MDEIRGLKDTAIAKVNLPTLAAFIPLLEEKRTEITKIERKEFKYGQKNRNYLDVYYPPAGSAFSTPNGKLPVLFFIYGGDYHSGSRRFPEPYDMGYRALGSFFAARGFLTVIPDYRLVPEVQFPAASEDVRDALLWIGGHAAEVAGGATGPRSARTELDPSSVFILGHSAGAAHALVLHLYPPLRASFAGRAVELGVKIRGIVLSGGPWYFSMRGESFTTGGPVRSYFGGAAEQKEREPRGLWAALTDDDVRALPDVLLVQAEREPNWLRADTRDVMEQEMRAKLEKVGKGLEKTYIAEGHNHVSVNWALCTGDGRAEKWGYDVTEWITARLN